MSAEPYLYFGKSSWNHHGNTHSSCVSEARDCLVSALYYHFKISKTRSLSDTTVTMLPLWFRSSTIKLFGMAHIPFARKRVMSLSPRNFPTTGFKMIPSTEVFEEENWPWYTPQSFYPVRIGDVFCSKYQVLFKVDYGTTSTIWICRDLR